MRASAAWFAVGLALGLAWPFLGPVAGWLAFAAIVASVWHAISFDVRSTEREHAQHEAAMTEAFR